MMRVLRLGVVLGVCGLCTGLPLAANAAEGTARADNTAKVPGAKQRGEAAEAKTHEADNTGRNKRDRDDKTLTADDQGNSGSEVEALAKIRRAIIDDDALSVNAHNVKIILEKNTVTLRGVVNSKAEKQRVEALAKQSADGKRIVNKLDVSP